LRFGLGLALLLASGCARDATAPTVWVGHLAPLGDARGELAARAMQLALQRWQEDGFSAGGKSVGVRHADSTKGQARAEATRLLAVNRVAALIVGPGVCDVEDVLALARPRETPLVVLDEVADAALAGPAILLGPDPKERGQALAEHALALDKRKRVLVVTDPKDRVAAALAAAFTEAWRQGGGTITESVAEKGDVSAVLLALSAERVAGGVESLKTVAPNVPILYGGPDGDRPSAAGRHTVLEATAFTDLAELTEAGRAWVKRFAERFRVPPGWSAALAHDGLEFVLSGLRETEGASVAKLKQELASRESFEGLTGAIRWSDGRPLRTLYLVREAGGKRTLLKTIPAGRH
jgi:ABC-type branched-subunit amino acid transport system substrate-binding protein